MVSIVRRKVIFSVVVEFIAFVLEKWRVRIEEEDWTPGRLLRFVEHAHIYTTIYSGCLAAYGAALPLAV